jgi:hypothetical protein
MRSRTLVPPLLAALLLIPIARADDSDELGTLTWQGKKTWFTDTRTGGTPAPSTPTAPIAPTPGTPTPPDEEDDPLAPPDEGGTVTPGTGGETEPEPGPGPDAEPEPGIDPTPPSSPPPSPPMDPAAPTICNARWTLVEVNPTARVESDTTLLTATLLSTDVYGYVSNCWARANSTLFIDWFATTTARKEGQSRYEATIALVGGCGRCRPLLDFKGTAHVDTQGLVKVWGTGRSVAEGSYGFGQGSSNFSSPLSVTARAGVKVSAGTASEAGTVTIGPVKMSVRANIGRHYDANTALNNGAVVLTASRMIVKVGDQARVEGYAGGDMTHSEGKALAGHEESVEGTTACGASCVFRIDQIVAR